MNAEHPAGEHHQVEKPGQGVRLPESRAHHEVEAPGGCHHAGWRPANHMTRRSAPFGSPAGVCKPLLSPGSLQPGVSPSPPVACPPWFKC